MARPFLELVVRALGSKRHDRARQANYRTLGERTEGGMMVDTRTDHNPILPANLSEIDLRSMIRRYTRAIAKTRNGGMILNSARSKKPSEPS